jgi:hypothetical protein
MKLTREQLKKAEQIYCDLPSNDNFDDAQAIADYLEPLFAAELLKPCTKEEGDAIPGKSFGTDVVNHVLASRLAPYLPKKITALEATRTFLGEKGYWPTEAVLTGVVEVIRKADQEASK